MASRDFRIGTEVAFYGRNTINSTPVLFVVLRPFSIFKQSQKRKRRKSLGEFNRYQKR